MRILVVHNRYRPVAPSGEDVVVDQERAALVARGHQVALFERRSAEIAEWSKVKRATLPARVVWGAQARRSLAETLIRYAPDVVHVHNTFPLLTPSVLYACRDAQVPVVATLHNYKLACASGDLFRQGRVCHDCLGSSAAAGVRHGCYRGSRLATVPVAAGRSLHAPAWRSLVSAYVFISAAQRDRLAPLGLPAGRSFVKHNFVPPPQLSASPSADEMSAAGKRADANGAAGRRAHAVAFVGRLDAAKGAPLLMAGWDAFRRRRPRSALRLEVAGGGPLAEQLTGWAQRHPSVGVHGLLSRDDAIGLLARSRAALVPSAWEETFGLVAVEAMATGTAPIAAAHGAFPELITPAVDGTLFAPGDADALADALAEVDDHPDRYARLGRQALDTYRRRFTPDGNIATLLDIYEFARQNPVSGIGPSRGIAGLPARSPW